MLHSPTVVDVYALLEQFHPSAADFADFESVESPHMPGVYRRLLDHNSHMTTTVEAYHGCPVSLAVLDRRFETPWYSRQILLSRNSDDRVVQLGIVRINVDSLAEQVRAEIEEERTPLGRLLIENKVLRRVRRVSLWRIRTRRVLTRLLGLGEPRLTYGRTAAIDFAGQLAIELLEIVAPCNVASNGWLADDVN